MSKGLPDFLKKARKNALKTMAAQLGGSPPRAAAPSVGPGSDGFQSGRATESASSTPGGVAASQGRGLWATVDPGGAPGATSISAVDRERLVGTATQLFARGGFRRLNLDDVARQAEVPRAVVASGFGTKEALLFECVSQEVETFLAEAKSWVDSTVAAPELLAQVSQRAFEYIGHHPLMLQLMLGLLSDLAPAYEERFHGLRNRFTTVTQEVLRIGVEQGAFRANLDIETTSLLLFELHVASYMLHLQDTSNKVERAATRRRVALDLVLNGLRA